MTAMAKRESGLRYMVARMAWQILGDESATAPAFSTRSAAFTTDARIPVQASSTGETS